MTSARWSSSRPTLPSAQLREGMQRNVGCGNWLSPAGCSHTVSFMFPAARELDGDIQGTWSSLQHCILPTQAPSWDSKGYNATSRQSFTSIAFAHKCQRCSAVTSLQDPGPSAGRYWQVISPLTFRRACLRCSIPRLLPLLPSCRPRFSYVCLPHDLMRSSCHAAGPLTC